MGTGSIFPRQGPKKNFAGVG